MTTLRTVRGLTGGELRDANWIYGNNIDFGRVRIYRGRYAFWQPDNTAMSPNGNIYFPDPIYHSDFSIGSHVMWLMSHELAHVWQVQSGVWLKIRRVLEGGLYDYGRLSAERALRSYTVEQQASIIADWYRLRHRLNPHHGSGDIAIYEAVVRGAIPAATP